MQLILQVGIDRVRLADVGEEEGVVCQNAGFAGHAACSQGHPRIPVAPLRPCSPIHASSARIGAREGLYNSLVTLRGFDEPPWRG